MAQYHFPQAELWAEHQSHAIERLDLQVNIPAVATPAQTDAPQGLVSVWGSFSFLCKPSNCPLRRGQVVQLKLCSPDGRWTKADAVLTQILELTSAAAGVRDYRWEFLIPIKPAYDPNGLFRREGDPAPPPRGQGEAALPPWQLVGPMARAPLKPVRELDPAAQELALADLLAELTVGESTQAASFRFTREGGIVPAAHASEEGSK